MVAYTVLTAFLYWASPTFYRAMMLPLWRMEIDWLQDFEVESAEIQSDGRHQNLNFEITFRKPVMVSRNQLAAVDIQGPASIMLGSLNSYPLIVFSLLAAWPGLPLRKKAKTGLMAAALILLVLLVDVPLWVAGELESIKLPDIKTDLAVHRAPYRTFHFVAVFTRWVIFNGGRQIMAGLIFCLCLLPHYIHKAPVIGKEISRNAPCPCGSGKKYKRCCSPKRF